MATCVCEEREGDTGPWREGEKVKGERTHQSELCVHVCVCVCGEREKAGSY